MVGGGTFSGLRSMLQKGALKCFGDTYHKGQEDTRRIPQDSKLQKYVAKYK